jgi:hypothetical protein
MLWGGFEVEAHLCIIQDEGCLQINRKERDHEREGPVFGDRL